MGLGLLRNRPHRNGQRQCQVSYNLAMSLPSTHICLSLSIPMAAIASLSLPAVGKSERRLTPSLSRPLSSNCHAVRLFTRFSFRFLPSRTSVSTSPFLIYSMSTFSDVPTVSETKSNFLKAYKRPIPSIYNTVLQELIVQQHLTRYKRTYRYDPVFALGFVTVYDQLMEGYPSNEDRDAIFKAYIKALSEDPDRYRSDAQRMEEWARSQTSASLLEFSSRKGEVEETLKDIAESAGTKGGFSYSRFFAVGLFRLLELANATEPTVLDKLCASLNINKKSVDRDLDVYRNMLSKLVQAKELLKEYVDREKKKGEERAEKQRDSANETLTKCSREILLHMYISS